MKVIYIDDDYLCHAVDDGTRMAVETEFFNGKCDAFIEGYRFVPAGKNWIRADGVKFEGQMVAPAKNYATLAAAQRQYETAMEELNAAYLEGVNSV